MYARIFHKRVRQSQEWGRGLGQPYRTHARGLRSTLSWGRGGARRTRWVHIHNMSHHHARVDCTSHFQASHWNGTVMWGEVELKLTLGQKKSKGFKSTPPYGVSTGLDAPIIIGTCTELGRFPLCRSRPPPLNHGICGFRLGGERGQPMTTGPFEDHGVATQPAGNV